MPRATGRKTKAAKAAGGTKYDAHHVVLDQTYGALADLRRELADSKDAVAERKTLLETFAVCKDSQRAWLLLEDYFERISLSRRDFGDSGWWDRIAAAEGEARLQETAMLFMRTGRSIPSELMDYADFERFAEIEEAERKQELVKEFEGWLLPPAPKHLDSPRAALKLICDSEKGEEGGMLHDLVIRFSLYRPRTGYRWKSIGDITDLTTRASHEQEQFSSEDWEIIEWLNHHYPGKDKRKELRLNGHELLHWLASWGHTDRLRDKQTDDPLEFHGQIADLKPGLEETEGDLVIVHRLSLPGREAANIANCICFRGNPSLGLLEGSFFLMKKAVPEALLGFWSQSDGFPISHLSHRLLTHFRKTGDGSSDWSQLCVAHRARPQFVFELSDETVKLRLRARSEKDKSEWQWNGHEWEQVESEKGRQKDGRPHVLDDERLEPAVQWLRRLDWFTPEAGLWVGDATEGFLNGLAQAWSQRPEESDFLGNPSFHRLFLSPQRLKPKLVLMGSGIDWLSVSAEWEEEGLKLTKADLERLAAASSRFVKLPDSGWVELDEKALEAAHEAMADLGLEDLSADGQQVSLVNAAHLNETSFEVFKNSDEMKRLRESAKKNSGVDATGLPATIQATLRPYQKDGFDFLCHLSKIKLGGVLADDMGLGKTLQTLSWIDWCQSAFKKGKAKPALVICPASVLHNWRREAERFTPHLQVLVLESGSGRKERMKKIPENNIVVTNYALLRRDLEELKKHKFSSIILDEAQFIKNPSAQVTQSVKKLKADQRLALTGTPLENRLTDLWSIIDFSQPGYLGTQTEFSDNYEPKGQDAEYLRKIARRRLSARLRPVMLRRLKKQVAKDLPDRIEERRDCHLDESQRSLYLAELRRSRDKVMETVRKEGVKKSKIHVLAALTRLRQICCHPTLVGSDAASGKTDTLFELVEPLMAEGQKVLVFSQFVRMLRILEAEMVKREIPCHILTGETKNRQEIVKEFQEDTNASVFLLSLRAAGTGLNLTTASYVILYDPWWNPAVEAQAIDRSHRIGQTQTVNAYRMISPGTVEEKIWDLQQRKAKTITDVLGEDGFAKSLDAADLDFLFSDK